MSDNVELATAVFQAVASFIGLLITVGIAWLVHRLTRRAAQVEHARDLKSTWIAVDSVVFSNDALLKVADQLVHEGTEGDAAEVRQKRWLCLMLLNPLTTLFSGIEAGLLDPRAMRILERELNTLVRDDMCYSLPIAYGYAPGFVDLCRRLRTAQTSGP